MVTVLTPDESLRTGLPASGNSSARGTGEPVKSALANRGETTATTITKWCRREYLQDGVGERPLDC
ncbi:hypothetical protein DIPPA_34299 [Diplonema papillatum]|nr:hypothetical protein DIPPA_34299 [Diplonema papillatum]